MEKPASPYAGIWANLPIASLDLGSGEMVTFELKTLTDYSEEAVIAELRRVAAAIGDGPLTIARFNEIGRVNSTTVRRRFGSWDNALIRAGLAAKIPPRPVNLSRVLVLNELKKFAGEFPGKPATQEEIATRLKVDKSTIIKKCGSWSGLLAEVGMEQAPLGRRYTDEECYENIVALWTYYGRQPNFAELNCSPSLVGSKAYVRRWGGWRKALGAFIDYVNAQAVEPQANVEPGPPETSVEVEGPKSAAPPRSLSLALRYRVLSRDKFKCVACGRNPAKDPSVELHVDHVIPWSKGGQNTEDNLRTLCFACNLGKGARLD